MAILNEIEAQRKTDIYQRYVANKILDKICKIKNEKGINNTELAEITGVKKSAISRLFTDGRNLTVKKLASIFHALGEEVEILTKSEVSALKKDSVVTEVKFVLRKDSITHWLKQHQYRKKKIPLGLIGESYGRELKSVS